MTFLHRSVFANERAIRFQFVDRRHILMPGVNITQSTHHLYQICINARCKWVTAGTEKLAGRSRWRDRKADRDRAVTDLVCSLCLLFRLLATGDEDEYTLREAGSQYNRHSVRQTETGI